MAPRDQPGTLAGELWSPEPPAPAVLMARRAATVAIACGGGEVREGNLGER